VTTVTAECDREHAPLLDGKKNSLL
jgi:hypothetical protein